MKRQNSCRLRENSRAVPTVKAQSGQCRAVRCLDQVHIIAEQQPQVHGSPIERVVHGIQIECQQLETVWQVALDANQER